MAERLSLDGFEACAVDYDHCVERRPELDRFCSRSEWILPFHRAFLPGRELFVYRDGDSFVALASREHPSVGRYLEALENMWCFACPLIGEGAVGLLEEAITDLAREQAEGHDRVAMVLSGIPASRDPESVLGRLITALDGRYELRAVDTTVRWVATLAGGLDGWLARRSASFRRNLGSAARKSAAAGVAFERIDVSHANVATVYERVLEIESMSWKSAEGAGLDQGSMLAFYRDMLPRLAARGGLRVLVARVAGRDVGYVYGTVIGDHFRGLQMSSDQSLAHLSLGNLLQREMIARLCDEGIQTYDLGTHSEYKRRWAEEGLKTITILARPA